MPLPDQYGFLCPSKLLSGQGALENLPVELQGLGAVRPLLLADKQGPSRRFAKRVEAAFKGSRMNLGIFDAVPPAPSGQFVSQLAALVRDKGHDALVAVGSGKIADVAKGVRLAAAHPSGAMALTRGENGAPARLLPFVLVMTGPGSGLEASGRFSLAGTELWDHCLMPELVLVDPKAIDLENGRTAAESALGILARGAEACATSGANPMVETYAHAALSLVRENIAKLLESPGDKKAKTALTDASYMAAVASSNAPVGPAQCLAAAAAEMIGQTTGLISGMILPYSLGWFAARDQEPVARLLLSLGGFDRFSDTNSQRRPEAAIETIFELIRALEPLGITAPLGPLGVGEATIPDLAAKAAEMGTDLNPADLADILTKAAAGGSVVIA